MGVKDVKESQLPLPEQLPWAGHCTQSPRLSSTSWNSPRCTSGKWGAGIWALSPHIFCPQSATPGACQREVFSEQASVPFAHFSTTWHNVGSKDFTGQWGKHLSGVSGSSLVNTESMTSEDSKPHEDGVSSQRMISRSLAAYITESSLIRS